MTSHVTEIELQEALAPLVGRVCWRARASYGDELRLDLGRRIRGPLPTQQFGEWEIGSRVSEWTLNANGAVVGRSRDSLPDVLPVILEHCQGRRCAGIKITGPRLGVSLSFEGGATLDLEPPADEREQAWEVFSPKHRVVSVGPGRAWQSLDSRAPSILSVQARTAPTSTPTPTNLLRVFVSFAHEDYSLLRSRLRELSEADLSFAIEYWQVGEAFKSRSGAKLRTVLKKHLSGQSVFVVLLSPTAARNEWVDWEIKEIAKLGTPVAAAVLPGVPQSAIPKALQDLKVHLIEWNPKVVFPALEAVAKAARGSTRHRDATRSPSVAGG